MVGIHTCSILGASKAGYMLFLPITRVAVPLFFMDKKRYMKVEVQIRTIAMDFWASLEHQLKYKQKNDCQESITKQLKGCADIIAATDEHMLKLREEIEQMSDAPTDEDLLYEKLSKLDLGL